MNLTCQNQTLLSTTGSPGSIRFCGLLILLLCLKGTLYAQFPVSLHPLLGSSIDAQEAERVALGLALPLFHEQEFDSLRMLWIPGQEETLLHVFQHGSGEPEVSILTESQVSQLRRHVHRHLKGLRDWFVLKETLVQSSPIPLKVVRVGGAVLHGEVLEIDNHDILLRTDDEVYELGWVEIEELKVIQQKVPGYSEMLAATSLRISAAKLPRAPYRNTHSTHYLFAPSAIPLHAGNGYYRNPMLIMSSGTVGLTNHISVSGGAAILSSLMATLSGEPSFLGYASLKAGVQVANQIYVGGGIMAGRFAPSWSSFQANTLYGMVTFGNPRSHFTSSWSLLAINGKLSRRPLMMFSGYQRIGKNVGLVSENWVLTTVETSLSYTAGLCSIALRVTNKRTSLDFGCFSVANHVNFYDNRKSSFELNFGILPFFGFSIVV